MLQGTKFIKNVARSVKLIHQVSRKRAYNGCVTASVNYFNQVFIATRLNERMVKKSCTS